MGEQQVELAVINIDGEEAYIEVSKEVSNDSSYHDNTRRTDDDGRLQLNASQMNQLVKVGKTLLGELGQFDADETEVSFGIKAGGEGSVFCFAKANAEAQFNVKLTWRKKNE